MQSSSHFRRGPSRASRGFTLIEIVIVVCILAMLLLLAIPSMEGVLADKRLRRSLDEFNSLVRTAQERSVSEHRAYLIVWGDKDVIVRPEVFTKDEEHAAAASFSVERGSTLTLSFPAALTKKQPGEWIFWPSGICEPAIVRFEGHAGSWTETYSALTGQGELSNYAAK